MAQKADVNLGEFKKQKWQAYAKKASEASSLQDLSLLQLSDSDGPFDNLDLNLEIEEQAMTTASEKETERIKKEGDILAKA